MGMAAMMETFRALRRETGAALARVFGASGTGESRCPRGLTPDAVLSELGPVVIIKPRSREAAKPRSREAAKPRSRKACPVAAS